MTQLSGLALSEISTAFLHAGVSETRDIAGLSETLLLVRSRVRNGSQSSDQQSQTDSIRHCVTPLVQWLDKEPDIVILPVQQKVDLLWNLYSATVSRTVLADRFPLVCSNEDVWNETMTSVFMEGGVLESPTANPKWFIRWLPVILGVVGCALILMDQYLDSGRWRVYCLLTGTGLIALGGVLWQFPCFSGRRQQHDLSVQNFNNLPFRNPSMAPPPGLEQVEQTPVGVPPFPGTTETLGAGSSTMGGLIAVGTQVLLNGMGPTAPLAGQRGVVTSAHAGLYEVVLGSGMNVNKLPLQCLTVVPRESEKLLTATEPTSSQVPTAEQFYAPFVDAGAEKIKQQAVRLKTALEKAQSLQSTMPAWGRLFWQAVKNEVDVYTLEPTIRDVLVGHGYVGPDTIGPPRYEELKKKLTEMENQPLAPHGSGAALLRSAAGEAVSDPEQMAWHLKLPADLQRAAPELYRNIRAEGVSSVRQWVNEQHAGLEAKNTTQFQDLFMAATIIDFELADCKTEAELMSRLATSDTLEIHLRKMGAFIYYRRTKDKTGANRMLGLRAPGSQTDIAPKWMLDDANVHSKTEYQRLERGQKLNRLEQGDGGGKKGGGKGGKGGGKGGGRGKPTKKGGATTQG